MGRDVLEAARRISGNAGQLAMSINIKPRRSAPTAATSPRSCRPRPFSGRGRAGSRLSAKLAFVDILAPSIIPCGSKGRRLPDLPDAGARQRRRAAAAWRISRGDADGPEGRRPRDGPDRDHRRSEASKPGNRFNDGKCDRRGASSPARWRSTQRRPWRALQARSRRPLPAGGRRFPHLERARWSPDDRRFYFTDSGARRIYVYDYDIETGALARRRTSSTCRRAPARPTASPSMPRASSGRPTGTAGA